MTLCLFSIVYSVFIDNMHSNMWTSLTLLHASSFSLNAPRNCRLVPKSILIHWTTKNWFSDTTSCAHAHMDINVRIGMKIAKTNWRRTLEDGTLHDTAKLHINHSKDSTGTYNYIKFRDKLLMEYIKTHMYTTCKTTCTNNST